MKNTLIRIAVAGANGKMGRKIIQAVTQSKQVTLGAKLNIDRSILNYIDTDNLSDIGIAINDNLKAVKDDFDILIDFTRPDASMEHLNFCRLHHKGIIIGTTGFSDIQQKNIIKAAKETRIVFAANFSIGVNIMLKLLEKTAKLMGEEADIEIIETHHRHKVDAPSGTALAMGKKITEALGREFTNDAVYNRERDSGRRKIKSIGFATVRAGDIIGEHTVMFASLGERLEITHRASNRAIFAHGAIRAAIWLLNQKNGLYNMSHVLNLNKS